jgi:hypothetical protein
MWQHIQGAHLMDNASTAATVTKSPVERRELRPPRPRTPHTAHLRELSMPDGRRLLLDRRSIAFLVEGKPEEFGGKQVTIVAFKTQARACPVVESYPELKAWWHGPDAENGGAT